MNQRIWGIIGGLALVVALLSPYVLGSNKKVERLFEAAETLYEQNDYEGAIKKYSEALKESKKPRAKTEAIDKDFTTLVNFKIAMSYIQLAEQENNAGHYQNALKYIEKAAETAKFPEYEEKLTYQWGYIFYKMGQLEQALEKLEQFVEEFPNNPLVAKAEKIIEKIRPTPLPDPIDGIPPWINDLSKFEAFNKEKNQRLVVPNRLRASAKFTKAAAEYEVFARDSPDTKQAAYALYWAGFCYSPDLPTVLSDKSIAVFGKLIDNYPESRYAANARKWIEPIPPKPKPKPKPQNEYFDRGMEHFENGAYAQAIDYLTKALKIDPQCKEAYHLLGSAYLITGEFQCALECARKALAIDSNYQDAKNLMNAIDIGALRGECEHNIP